jgi:hypothetical protein
MVETFTVIKNIYHYSEFNERRAKMKFPKLFPIEFEENLRAWLTHQGDLRDIELRMLGWTNG